MDRSISTGLLSLLLMSLALPAAAQQPGAVAGALTVDQLVTLALSRNPDLMAVREQAAEARGRLLQSGFRPSPGLEASIGSGAVAGSPGEGEYAIGYAHTLELGGKRERRLAAGTLGVELAKLAAADRERLLRATVKARFGEALGAMRNLEAASRLLELSEQSLRIASAREQHGEGAALDRALAEVETNRLRSDRLLFSNQAERALLELKTLASMTPDEPLRLRGELALPAAVLPLAGAVSRALAGRPDLLAARLEINRSDAEVALAEAGAVPDLVVTGRYSRSSTRFDAYGLAAPGGAAVPLRDTDNVLTAGVSITLPVRNRNQGNIQAAIARRQAARYRAAYLEQTVRQEVGGAYSRFETVRQAARLFEEGVVRQSEDNLSVLRAAYDLGERQVLDVISEQRRLVETQRSYTDILLESYRALVDLERATAAPLF